MEQEISTPISRIIPAPLPALSQVDPADENDADYDEEDEEDSEDEEDEEGYDD